MYVFYGNREVSDESIDKVEAKKQKVLTYINLKYKSKPSAITGFTIKQGIKIAKIYAGICMPESRIRAILYRNVLGLIPNRSATFFLLPLQAFNVSKIIWCS